MHLASPLPRAAERHKICLPVVGSARRYLATRQDIVMSADCCEPGAAGFRGTHAFAHRRRGTRARRRCSTAIMQSRAVAEILMPSQHERPSFNRRAMIRSTATMAAATILNHADSARAQGGTAGADAPLRLADGTSAPINLSLDINGRSYRASVDSRASLLDVLREHFGLAGTKKGCDQGQCGACTVHVDGKPVLSCLTLAAMAEGRVIRTIEGLADGRQLHPVQQAFIDHDAFQCGYCTPGQIMSAVACIEEGYATSDDEIREFMSGNLCRCAAYPNIVAAIRDTAGKMEPT